MERLLALKASAGSGKTFALAVRYVSLLILGAKPEEIAALTFTNKAANEMKVRIGEILARPEAHGAEIAAIAEETGKRPEEVVERMDAVRGGYLRANLQISTIDSFVNGILRAFAINLGMRPDFEIGEFSEEEMLENYLREVIRSGRADDLIGFAREEDRRIEQVQRYFRDLEEKEKEVMPIFRRYVEEVEPVTKEMVDAAEALAWDVATRLRAKVVEHPAASATAKNQMAFENVREVLEKKWLARETLKYRTFAKVWDEQMDELLHALRDALQNYTSLREMRSLQTLAELYLLYKKASFEKKRAADVLGFADVTNYAYDIIHSGRFPADMVLFRLDNRVGHLLVDEFQDTSVVQYMILRPLIEEIVSGAVDSAGLRKTFFYVGDTKQSIYRFRGANRYLFDHVAAENGVAVRHLDTNYRSSRSVVEYTNEIFARRYGDFVNQKPRPGAPEGLVEVEEAADMMAAAVEKVAALTLAGVAPGSIAVLLYTNGEVAEFRELMREKMPNTPAITDSSAKLVNQPQVKALIALVKHMHKKEAYYLALFNALRGNRPDAPVDLRDAEIFRDNPLALVLHLCDRFGIYNGDPNVANFVELCGRFRDLEDFYHNVDALSEPIANAAEVDAVRILTIHKSKGLEFDNVVVVDRTRPKARNTSAFVYETEGVRLRAVRYRMKAKESFDPDYRAAIEKEAYEEYIDRLNALYVALTRAKNRLYVVKNPDFGASEFAFADIVPHRQGSFGDPERPKEAAVRGETPAVSGENYGDQAFVDVRRKTSGLLEEAFRFALEVVAEATPEAVDVAVAQARTRYGMWLDDRALAAVRDALSAAVARDFFKEAALAMRAAPVPLTKKTVDHADFLHVGENAVEAVIVALSDADVRRAARLRRALAKLYPGREARVLVERLY